MYKVGSKEWLEEMKEYGQSRELRLLEARKELSARYPDWADRIMAGDFFVNISRSTRTVVWPNTSIWAPTGEDLAMVLEKEFGLDGGRIKIKASMMSLSISAKIKK
ncbi:MAG: hypothetical protein A3H57_01515 [Candidatus Taylorbacteria bacterium RIFCSPLOWO2_02_FULL_43_11]|uniref:Uncharacterized protein n=1 Tax=Candidatus Taylorbacteria bacterium RIFCSPHIGHO2_02_FULL_43_32b TaxID=1802306 RepID=A0A1G2MK71_9BACT|nr:MAG: hypothetical protein A2743_00985 [Candidatus Taylorbacteria bacterium RIFCSPHIGHO2_01_FULL_43_47]OHA24273.1 MAG: hypothetical protein A3C72_04400 [Candidatus Taylorbacteria bacterium RIFCSPHIGHO2_02_FULL_43_32b]OHA31390.1 MAG: hypothetical protein A3B08_00620 [Candidatus Taylorbacteria bacterium RIFCSPLOWO2_01_FULL_43_44]OHA36585.1 MAG: hypothetical protein A3H57_01515 [Candidatus Taylorbacteria bacterium RIFCSPLOWO2_02_FULL_43_11]